MNRRIGLQSASELRNYFAAIDDIKKGKINLADFPLCASILEKYWHSYCDYCYKEIEYYYERCDSCCEVVFCNHNCARKGIPHHKRFECGVWDCYLRIAIYSMHL